MKVVAPYQGLEWNSVIRLHSRQTRHFLGIDDIDPETGNVSAADGMQDLDPAQAASVGPGSSALGLGVERSKATTPIPAIAFSAKRHRV